MKLNLLLGAAVAAMMAGSTASAATIMGVVKIPVEVYGATEIYEFKVVDLGPNYHLKSHELFFDVEKKGAILSGEILIDGKRQRLLAFTNPLMKIETGVILLKGDYIAAIYNPNSWELGIGIKIIEDEYIIKAGLPAAVPVPAAGMLLITAIGGLGLLRRRRKAGIKGGRFRSPSPRRQK